MNNLFGIKEIQLKGKIYKAKEKKWYDLKDTTIKIKKKNPLIKLIELIFQKSIS